MAPVPPVVQESGRFRWWGQYEAPVKWRYDLPEFAFVPFGLYEHDSIDNGVVIDFAMGHEEFQAKEDAVPAQFGFESNYSALGRSNDALKFEVVSSGYDMGSALAQQQFLDIRVTMGGAAATGDTWRHKTFIMRQETFMGLKDIYRPVAFNGANFRIEINDPANVDGFKYFPHDDDGVATTDKQYTVLDIGNCIGPSVTKFMCMFNIFRVDINDAASFTIHMPVMQFPAMTGGSQRVRWNITVLDTDLGPEELAINP